MTNNRRMEVVITLVQIAYTRKRGDADWKSIHEVTAVMKKEGSAMNLKQ
jgi:hypothetical protein